MGSSASTASAEITRAACARRRPPVAGVRPRNAWPITRGRGPVVRTVGALITPRLTISWRRRIMPAGQGLRARASRRVRRQGLRRVAAREAGAACPRKRRRSCPATTARPAARTWKTGASFSTPRVRPPRVKGGSGLRPLTVARWSAGSAGKSSRTIPTSVSAQNPVLPREAPGPVWLRPLQRLCRRRQRLRRGLGLLGPRGDPGLKGR